MIVPGFNIPDANQNELVLYRAIRRITSGGGGSAVWGSITGTLSAQTDLNTALGTKQPIDADLTAIAALGFTSSALLRKTAANTWTLDTNAYITGITSGDVISALGFTPYDASNPSGYISSVSLNAGEIGFGDGTNLLTSSPNFTFTAFNSVTLKDGIAGNTFINGGGSITLGSANIGIGSQAGGAGIGITSGSGNILMGAAAGSVISTASNNIVIGNSSGLGFNGDENVAIGFNTGANISTGVQNIFLGSASRASVDVSNSIAIGSGAVVTVSNQLVIGSIGNTQSITEGYFGNGVECMTGFSPVDFIFRTTNANAADTDTIGANMKFVTGLATGSANSGSFIWYTGDVGGSGTTLQTATEKMKLDNVGTLFLTSLQGTPNRIVTTTFLGRLLSDTPVYTYLSTAPTVNEDDTLGYVSGLSRVIDTTTQIEYLCTSNATGAATWQAQSGTYTPTITDNNGTTTASTDFNFYVKGNICTIYGWIQGTPSGTICNAYFSLPVLPINNFSSILDVIGCLTENENNVTPVTALRMLAVSGDKQFSINFSQALNNPVTYTFSLSYKINN